MIELLHSYQYLSNNRSKLFIKDREIVVDGNDNFLFGLSNIPKNKKIYNIRLNKINTKKRSLKFNRNNDKFNYFNTNANLKIMININKNEFINSINKGIIPSEEEVVKLLKRSVKQNIKHDEYVTNLIKDVSLFHEYSWYSNRENNEEVTYLPHNIYKIDSKYIDLDTRKIYDNSKECSKTLSLCGGIILNNVNNNFKNIVKIINNNSDKKTLIITDNTKIWEKEFQNNTYHIINQKLSVNSNIQILSISLLNEKNKDIIDKLLSIKYYRIIYHNCLDKKISIEKLKSFNTLKKWYITDKTYLLKFDDLCKIYNLMFSYNLTYFDYELLKKTRNFFIKNNFCKNVNNVVFTKTKVDLTLSEKNFYKKYCNKDDSNIYFSLPLNKTNVRFTSIGSDIYNSRIKTDNCCICLNKITKNNYGITSCKHTFCFSCIYKYTSNSNKCPICRKCNNTNTIYKVIDNSVKMDGIPSKVNYILKLIKKNKNIILCSKFEESVNSLENFFNDLQIKYKTVKEIDIDETSIVLTTYKNLFNLKKISQKNIILIEPLLNNNQDYYNKSLLLNKFKTVNTKINVEYLVSKNTYEDFI